VPAPFRLVPPSFLLFPSLSAYFFLPSSFFFVASALFSLHLLPLPPLFLYPFPFLPFSFPSPPFSSSFAYPPSPRPLEGLRRRQRTIGTGVNYFFPPAKVRVAHPRPLGEYQGEEQEQSCPGGSERGSIYFVVDRFCSRGKYFF
jgi:hypothetical protein